MQYHDPKSGERYIPRCIESSTGLGRTVMAVMFDCYDEENLNKSDNATDDMRVVMRFPFAIAPVKCAILPLVEKDENMVALGRKIF